MKRKLLTLEAILKKVKKLPKLVPERKKEVESFLSGAFAKVGIKPLSSSSKKQYSLK